jgi:molecular chaperone DnaJ
MQNLVNHYQTLQITQQATQKEIKQAYWRLAKRFHPDSNSDTADSNKIITINAAYEILGDPQRRRLYDRELQSGYSQESYARRQQRTTQAQDNYKRRRQKEREADAKQLQWLKEVYAPINKLIGFILNPLEMEIDNLAADPFDDELMSSFQDYLEHCRNYLDRAQQLFASQPNPAKLASVAASIYYCLDRISDGIKEMEWYSYNYDDRYLHTGKELFRIARRLRREGQDLIKRLT